MKREARAVSTILTILLMLGALIVGAFISYMWVMASFYNMPNTTTLAVEDVVFPPNNFTYFNVTVLNPSNSFFDVNITSFNLVIEDTNETYSVTTAQPVLPFLSRVGTKQTFTCLENWSNFAGAAVRVEPVAENVSVDSKPYVTTKAKLTITGFDASRNVENFNLTILNGPDSALDLNISEVLVYALPVNVTPALPYTLAVNQTATFQCDWKWVSSFGNNATITVKTSEGYERVYVTNPIRAAFVHINDVSFYNTTFFDVTLKSDAQSTMDATLKEVKLTLDGTTITPSTSPPLSTGLVTVPPNASQTVGCTWDWNAYRNVSVVVQVSTKEGFVVENKTVTTPASVVWSADSAKFDLDDTAHFTVNVSNAPISLQNINVTSVMFNQNTTAFTPTFVALGTQVALSCGFNWSASIGQNVNITIHAVYDGNETSISQIAQVPRLKITGASFYTSPSGNPLMNVTIYNSQFSGLNATVAQISVVIGNVTSPVEGTLSSPRLSPNGTLLPVGTEITWVCPWDWSPYSNKDVTIAVQTVDGLQVSGTFKVE